jgi:hypothetical protein
MKTVLCSLFLIWLSLLGFGVACTSTTDSANLAPIVTTSSFEKSVKEEYLEALERWQTHQITGYEITVDVFSSFLSPACHMQATLVVQDDILVDVREITIPKANQLPDGKLISNPQCSEYERYRITSTLNLVDTFFHKKPSGEHIHDVRFDSEYGYITYLSIIGGESTLEINTSNFTLK